MNATYAAEHDSAVNGHLNSRAHRRHRYCNISVAFHLSVSEGELFVLVSSKLTAIITRMSKEQNRPTYDKSSLKFSTIFPRRKIAETG